jgi:hypothetical protein
MQYLQFTRLMFSSIIYLFNLQVQDRKSYEDIKGAIRSQKRRTDNAMTTMKKDKKANNSQQNSTQKTNLATRTPVVNS